MWTLHKLSPSILLLSAKASSLSPSEEASARLLGWLWERRSCEESAKAMEEVKEVKDMEEYSGQRKGLAVVYSFVGGKW